LQPLDPLTRVAEKLADTSSTVSPAPNDGLSVRIQFVATSGVVFDVGASFESPPSSHAAVTSTRTAASKHSALRRRACNTGDTFAQSVLHHGA
jgi:hypothetical protein